MKNHHAASVRGSGGAVITLARSDDGGATITAIQRFGLTIEPVAAHLRKLKDDDPEASVVVDAEGLGDAVWQLLDRPRKRGWRLTRSTESNARNSPASCSWASRAGRFTSSAGSARRTPCARRYAG